MVKLKFYLVTVIVLSILLVEGCASEQNSIKIGVITPLSGRLSTLGEGVQQGINLALEELNSARGINGQQVEIIFEDSQADISTAVTAATKLIEIDNVNVIIEVATSGEAMAVAALAEEKKVVHYSVLATTNGLIDAGEYIFKMRESATPHVRAIVSAIKAEDIKEISILHLSDEYCTNVVSQFKSEVGNRDLNINRIEKYNKDDSDFRTQITKLKKDSSEGIYVCGFYRDLGFVFKQLYELEIDKQLFSVTTFEHPLVKQNAGLEAIEGTIYSVSPLDCEENEEFCDKFRLRYGKSPDYRAAFAYDALKIVAQGLKAGLESEELKKALLTIDFDGVTGKTRFDEKGNSMKEVVLHEVRNGEWEVYEDK